MAPFSNRLKLHRGDITRLAVDAIVNAANPELAGGGGVDGAIHRAAGPDLAAYCRTLGGCPTGEARITPGFHLPAPWIIHTVGPVWQGGGHGEADLLASCYRTVFRLARAQGFRRLAIPAISCGVYGYPWQQAATIAVTESRAALRQHPDFKEILLVVMDDALAEIYRRALT